MNEEARMSNLERKVEGLEEKFDSSSVQTNLSIKTLADNVNRLVERDIKAAVHESYDKEWRERVELNQREQGRQIRTILDDRNKEQPSREFLVKHWPWLLVIVVIGSGVITKTFVN